MKSQIFAGIALLIAGAYTVEFNNHKELDIEPKRVRVATTEELIEKSSLHELIEKTEATQDSVSEMIREKVKDDVIDSVVIPKDTVIVKKDR